MAVYKKQLHCQHSRALILLLIITQHLPHVSGIVHVFIKHTSASLTINENADPSVRHDFETHFNKMVSEQDTHYTHTLEGPDDMTSHIKSSLLGSSVSFPITNGKPQWGTWQGIFYVNIEQGAQDN